jgi:lipoprotein-anchoring transpeptidase ErfK/SrfK
MAKFSDRKNFTTVPIGTVQCRCGCGKSADATGKCEECKAADRERQQHIINSQKNDAITDSGNPLDVSTRAFMESKFSQNFSNVRVHTNPQAQNSAQRIGAEAFTIGNNIAFAKGKYQPGTHDGKKLLAHELTHTLQQSGKPMLKLSEEHYTDMVAQNEPQEQEAQEMEQKVDVENSRDYEYTPDPELDGELPPLSDEEIATLLEEAGTQVAEEKSEEKDSISATPSESNAAPEEKDAAPMDPTLLAAPPEGRAKGKEKEEKSKDKPKGSKRIVVNLAKQEATAFEGDTPVKRMKISSGKKGHPTTVGPTKIGQRDIDHESGTYGTCIGKKSSHPAEKGKKSCKEGETYKGAPMPYFQRFGQTAEGFHVGDINKPNASHGCVRLGEASAKWLWDWAKSGTAVNVISGAEKKKLPAKGQPKKPANPPKKKKK